MALLVLCFTVPSASVFGQDSTRTAPDSLAERLRRAEEAIELLKSQMEAQAESQVLAASRVRVDLFGRVLMNAFSNSARVNNVDVPLFVRDSTARGGAGATVRQSSFGVRVQVDHVLGGRFDVDGGLSLCV